MKKANKVLAAAVLLASAALAPAAHGFSATNEWWSFPPTLAVGSVVREAVEPLVSNAVSDAKAELRGDLAPRSRSRRKDGGHWTTGGGLALTNRIDEAVDYPASGLRYVTTTWYDGDYADDGESFTSLTYTCSIVSNALGVTVSEEWCFETQDTGQVCAGGSNEVRLVFRENPSDPGSAVMETFDYSDYDTFGVVYADALAAATNALGGATYDFSSDADVTRAVRDLIRAFGGAVTNAPASN